MKRTPTEWENIFPPCIQPPLSPLPKYLWNPCTSLHLQWHTQSRFFRLLMDFCNTLLTLNSSFPVQFLPSLFFILHPGSFKNVNQVIHLCCLNLVSSLIFSRWCFRGPLEHSFCLDFKPYFMVTFSSPHPFVDCYYSLSCFHSLPSSPKLSCSHFAPVLQV